MLIFIAAVKSTSPSMASVYTLHSGSCCVHQDLKYTIDEIDINRRCTINYGSCARLSNVC